MSARVRRRAGHGDEGSLPLVMLFGVVALGVSLVLASVVATQQRGTRQAVQRTSAADAAHAGLQVAVGAIRAATRTDGSGDPARLPCAPITGAVSGAADATYAVTVTYTTDRPPPGDTAWAANAANRWACGSGATGTPAYAMIRSAGRSGTTRVVTATYAFTSVTRNEKIGGGVVRAFSGTNGSYCFSAAGIANLVGTPALIRACDGADARQRFQYQAGLQISLADLRGPAGQRLCLDGGATLAAGNPVTVQVCASTPVPRQKWGSDDASVFFLRPTATTLLCLRASAADTDGATLGLTPPAAPGVCEEYWTERATFITDPRFGAGQAGGNTRQLVNAEQFGRCIDVTSDDVTQPYLVVFPCKQPIGDDVRWNQRFDLPEVPEGEVEVSGPIHTTYDGATYCLRSPGNATPPYPTVEPCSVTAPTAAQQWLVRGDTGRRSTSFRIESAYQTAPGGARRCLMPTDPAAAAPDVWVTYNMQISKLVIATCDGSERQKWNPTSFSTTATLGDVVED